MDFYYNSAFVAEFLAAIFATAYLYKYKHTRLFWLLPLLWFIPINELICQFVFPRMPLGYLLYNLYKVLIPLSILGLVSSQLKKLINRRFITILIFLAILLYVLELFIINPFQEFLDYSFTAASFAIVAALLVYFLEELKGNYLSQTNKNLFLWVCFGFLLFHVPYPIIIFTKKFISNGSEAFIVTLNKIHLILCIFSYLVIAFGFYWGDKIPETDASAPVK